MLLSEMRGVRGIIVHFGFTASPFYLAIVSHLHNGGTDRSSLHTVW